MKISLVCPNRNNLRYFKWMYDSVRKNQGEHEVWICSAADDCSDGTLEYYEELSKKDPYFKYIVNDSGVRLGHTILYDRIINEIVTTPVAMIWHCDMYLCPGALDSVDELLYGTPEDPVIESRIVSLTRIEPPLHPPGPEKIILDCGMEPDEFDEGKLLTFLYDIGRNKTESLPENKLTKGIFAPWAFWVDDFKGIGGHNSIFYPQSKEDSDIFNRFKLNGVELVQTWKGFTYHLTTRGNRRNVLDGASNIRTDNPEWLAHNQVSTRNFIRIWGTMVQHDEFLYPIIQPRYYTEIVLNNPHFNFLHALEPYFDLVTIDDDDIVYRYIQQEQKNTVFDLDKKIKSSIDYNLRGNIVVEVDCYRFNNDDYYTIANLPAIISDSGEIGTFRIGNLIVHIFDLTTFERKLIDCRDSYLTDRYITEGKDGRNHPPEVLRFFKRNKIYE